MYTESLTFTQRLSFDHIYWRGIAQVFLGSLFLALCAQIAIFLPFSPVPITLQTFGVMLLGCMMGSRKAALTLLVYLSEGTLGLPVFAGGMINCAALIGPRAGFLIGMLLQAYLSGLISDKKIKPYSWHGLALLILSSLVQMSLGIIVLAPFVGWYQVLALGFYPFIIGEALKISTLAAISIPLKK